MGKSEHIQRVQLMPWMGYIHVAYPSINQVSDDCAAAHACPLMSVMR